MAWYNKYRPTTFAQTSGQTLVKKVLQNSSKSVFSQNVKVKHAYLFSGPRGTGKTSLARIFARSINCMDQHLVESAGEACGICDVCKNGQIDIIELDAASNTGIDNVRDLIEAANTPPFISRYKVYIIDEVHMLSKAAMNALLKTLEEPPSYIVFLMATTDPEKILDTILSRVTHLKLINHTLGDISEVLVKISKLENVNIDLEAINLIASLAKGGLRDAINLLETVSNYDLNHFSESEVAEILGVLPISRLEALANILVSGSFADLKGSITEFEILGTDPETLLAQLLDYLLTETLERYLKTEKLSNNFNYLIDVLADILSSNTSFGSVQSALVLVKIRLEPKEAIQITQNAPQAKSEEPSKTANATQETKEKKTLIIQNDVQITPEIPNNERNTFQIENSDEEESSDNVKKSGFKELIEKNLNQKEAPVMLKTFWGNIQTFEDPEYIYLFLPNKTFILPLKSSRTTDWLADMVKQNYTKLKRILIVTEDDTQNFAKIQSLIGAKETGKNIEENTPNIALPTGPSQGLGVVSNSTTKTTEATSNEQDFKVSDFYYLYAPLPDGTVPNGMKLYQDKKSEISSSEIKKTSNTDHWQDALSDLDFE